MPSPLIIAHRGASHEAPENTHASFALAWKQSADAVELDIHLTADGHIVVTHDPTTDRVTGSPGAIGELPLADIRTLDAGGWKAKRYCGEGIPVLPDVLVRLPADKALFIEIKCDREILAPLQEDLASSGIAPGRVTLMAFDFAVCSEAKRSMPQYAVCWLSHYSPHRGTGSQLADINAAIARIRAVGLDGFSLHPEWPITPEVARAILAAGLRFYVWTVNDDVLARRLAALGVHGIITDRPGWLRERLS